MTPEREPIQVSRRTVMWFGLASASALVVGQSRRGLAQTPPKGVQPKVIKETGSRIAGTAKVQLVEVTLQSGAVMPTSKMDSAMVCECTRGTLEVTLDENTTVTMHKGDIWACGVGSLEGVANKGTTPAIMRVFVLLA
jgi:quercetin dioxygenase-like cupin family protein